MAPGSKAICKLVFSVTYTNVHYPIFGKKRLAELLYLEDVANSGYSFFVGHEYLQHGGFGWRDSHSFCYHTCLISLIDDRGDTVTLACGASFPAVKQPTTGLKKIEAEHDAGGTSASSRMLDKRERQNEDPHVHSLDSAEDPNEKATAASIPLIYVLASLDLSFGSEEMHIVIVNHSKTTSSVLERVGMIQFLIRCFALLVVIGWSSTQGLECNGLYM